VGWAHKSPSSAEKIEQVNEHVTHAIHLPVA
jgi:hypothetical protein